MPAQAMLLSYDDLPPGSDIRRAYDRDAVRIVVPAGTPPADVVRQTAYDALASGAMASWALQLLSFIVFYFGLRNNRISGQLLVWAWAFFAIFCAALVMLVAWVRYGVMIDSVRAGRRQATVLAATPQRLLVETSGPFGVLSYELPRAAVSRIEVDRGRLRDDRAIGRWVDRLAVHLADGRIIFLLPGRDRRELRWAAAALREALDAPPPNADVRPA